MRKIPIYERKIGKGRPSYYKAHEAWRGRHRVTIYRAVDGSGTIALPVGEPFTYAELVERPPKPPKDNPPQRLEED